MENNINIWLERLSSLCTSQMRQASATEGVQLVHLEILKYLTICNEYSNNAQALSEYLGQTKGSISQSLKTMEKLGHIRRIPSIDDKRVFKLYITKIGKESFKRMSKHLLSFTEIEYDKEEAIKSILKNWQGVNNNHGFGQCISCKFNIKKGKSTFECGLTNLALLKSETLKICREHEFII